MEHGHRTGAERTSRRILLGVSVGILIMALVFAGFYVGYKRGVVAGTNVTITGIIGGEGDVENADFNLFWEAWQTLRENHIDSETIDNQELVYGAISGLAGSFGDVHTSFFPPEEARKFEQDVAGNFGGIGAEIGINNEGLLSVIAPLKGSPAERSGVVAGDIIVKIDDRSTDDMAVDEAVGYIRGAIGTSVVLNLYREGWLQPRDIRIVRENIKVPTLDLTYLENGAIAHLQLYSFNENAFPALVKSARELVANKARGIVLDLRNNPGGYLDAAIRIAGLFLKNGEVVVSEQFKDESSESFIAEGSAMLADIPVVVLINQGSASAAEILAGALRDVRGVKLVGEKSYGKGTVQEIKELSDYSTLKITIARWVMPDGGVLDRVGLEPDYLVPLTDDDLKAKRDVQIEKAVEVLKAQL